MVRRGFYFLHILTVLMAMLSTTPALAADAAPALEPVDEQRVWIEQTGADTGQDVFINVRSSEEYSAALPLVFQCDLRGVNTLSTAFLDITVTDPEGATLHTDKTQVYISEEVTSYSLAWDLESVPNGVYHASFTITKLPDLRIASRAYFVRKTARSELLALTDDAEARLAKAVESVRGLQAAGHKAPYLAARAAIAQDCIKYVRGAFADNPWRTTDRLVRYVGTTADSLRAQTVFLSQLPEFTQPIPEADMANVEFRAGVVYAGDNPVFLFGKNFGADRPAEGAPASLARLRAYGLNTAAFSLAPTDTLAAESADADFKNKFDPLLVQARTDNIGLFVALAPHELPAWALEQWPQIADPVLGGPNIANPEARSLIERHFRAAVPYLAKEDSVIALSLTTAPQFRFTGEDVRQGFIATVKNTYHDRQVLNQAWRALFSSLDEIATGWDKDNPKFERSERYIDKPAFQYDWQNYHQQLATQYLHGLSAFARSLAPDTPLLNVFAGDILDTGESRIGPDREAVGPQLDLLGCCAANTLADPHYALGYPQQPLIYTLLKSLAPGKPLVNFCDGVIPPYDPEQPGSFDYVHAAMWEAAMAGLNASALNLENWMSVPECLDGYVTACLDLNRLAEVVYAFQNDPAEVAILWSMSAKIFNDGAPFLQSIRFAYEGCSFGGYNVRFISEDQIQAGGLDKVRVLVLPETPSVEDATFAHLKDYIQNNGALIRTGAPILFDEHGGSRRDVITTTPRTVLLRGQNLPTEYLHCMDAVISFGTLPLVPRAINSHGYPLEGVRTRYIEHNGAAYLYVLNLRKAPIECHLAGGPRAGRDLIHGRDIAFPATLEPLRPMLVKFNEIPNVAPPTALVQAPEVPPQA